MKKERFTRELISPCGMNCGICLAFFGYQMNGKKRKLPCNGCRPRKNPCAFIKQKCNVLKHNQIQYCFECTSFPCDNLRTLDNRYRSKYGMSMIENLRSIQTNGMEKFLKNEQERWKCSVCGGVICVHNKVCYTCNQIR